MISALLEIVRVILGIAVLAFVLYAPGSVILNCLAAYRPASYLFSGITEWLFTAVLLSVLITGGLGFVLAELGWFHWWTVLVGILVVIVSAVLVSHVPRRARPVLNLLSVPKSYPLRGSDQRLHTLQRVLLLVLILVAAVLFSRPSEMIRGALDSGVYINDGVALARSGSIFQHDNLMRQLNDNAGEGRELLEGLNLTRYTLDRLRMPGFYVYDKQAGLVDPQHYFLFPTWIGFMDALFGIWGALYANSLLALLGVLSVYFFARRALSPPAALVALFLLILCPVTIWFARYPVSEVITGMLAFAGFFAFMRMLDISRERDPAPRPPEDDPNAQSLEFLRADSARTSWACFWGVVAGLCFGEMALARPDFIFYLAPLPIYLVIWRLARLWRRPHTWFAGTLLVVGGVFVAHYAIYSYPYTLDLYHNTIINLRRLWAPLLLALYAGVILLVAADRLYPRLRPLWSRAANWVVRYRWVWAGAICAVIALYVGYNYLVGPWLPNVRYDKNTGNLIPQLVRTTWESYIGAPTDLGNKYNLLRIGWYLSPLGLLLGAVGLIRWIWSRANAANGLFIGSLLISGFIFIDETYTDAHYIYTMRRYVPIILPALIMGFAWACQFFWTRIRPRKLGLAIAALLVAALAVYFVYTNRNLVPHVEEQGAVAELSSLASRFPGKSVVLFSNERDEPYVVATPLQYIFGVESFALARGYPDLQSAAVERAVKRWQSQGYKVWVMMGANGGKLDFPSFDLKEEGTWSYSVPEFEQQYYQKPSNVMQTSLPWGIYSLEPRASATPSFPFTINVGGMDYKYLVAGFYRQEKAPGDVDAWRWTGDQGIMRIPWPAGPTTNTLGSATLTIRLRPESPTPGKPAQRKDPVPVQLFVEDAPVGTVTVPPGSPFTDYTIQVPAGIVKTSTDPDMVLFRIKSPTWSPEIPGVNYDSRVLGIQLDAVQVRK